VPNPIYADCCPPQPNRFLVDVPASSRIPAQRFYVYMPSVFTPYNHDGMNDYFYPQMIDSLVYKDSDGYYSGLIITDTLGNRLYQPSTYSLQSLAPERYWNGLKPGTNLFYEGKFNWELRHGNDQRIDTLFGQGWCVICGPGTKHILDNPNCYLPSHGDENGNYIPKDPHALENLNCFK
jgi:hypothetical protein